MKLLFKFLINCGAIAAAAYILKGIQINDSFWTIAWVAIILGILNTLLRPILVILTIPITIMTLGFFILVINAGMVLLADKLIDGFSVNGFWWALGFSIIVWLINSILGGLDKNKKRSNEKY